MKKIMTYCNNSRCPFTDCERHLTHVTSEKELWVYLADLDGVCRRYISYLVDCAEKGEESA